MPKVILENKTGERFEATLYHDEVCRRLKQCHCRIVKTVTNKGRGIEHFPASFSIDKGAKSEPLTHGVLWIPQVKEAIKRGKIIRHDVVEPKKNKVVPAPAPNVKKEK
jgi:hypothetical protein